METQNFCNRVICVTRHRPTASPSFFTRSFARSFVCLFVPHPYSSIWYYANSFFLEPKFLSLFVHFLLYSLSLFICSPRSFCFVQFIIPPFPLPFITSSHYARSRNHQGLHLVAFPYVRISLYLKVMLVLCLFSLTISPHLRDIVYHTAIKFGGLEEWEFMWEKYQTSIDATEKSRILYALTGTKEPWLLNR